MKNKSTLWKADRGDGTYRNPVLFADYSDPDVIRVGEWFYMTASSFNCTPGLPILRSPDLVNWELIGHGIRNFPHERYDVCRPGCGVWAPAIRYHQGVFYIVFPSPDEGLYVVETRDPAGEWGEPRLLLEGKGLIDPCPLWDDDGKAYIVHGYAYSRAKKKSILHIIPVSPDLRNVLGEGQDSVYAMGRIPTLEGPKFHKFDGRYYISAPAGGVAQGWQMIFRSDSVYGPYEEKTVLAQRGSLTNGPHQGALVDDGEGAWWFIHFQEYKPWGRIVHLQPVRWEDGWPLMGTEQDGDGVGKPVPSWKKPAGPPVKPCAPAASDNFSGKSLGLQWQWNANHSGEWYELTGSSLMLKGGLYGGDKPEIEGMEAFGVYPRILGQKINAPEFTARVAMEALDFSPGDEAGIAVTGLESARLGICCGEEGLFLAYRRGEEILNRQPLEGAMTVLFVSVNAGGLCRFGYVEEGQIRYMGPPFQAKEGRWIGARFGLYCLGTKETSRPVLEVSYVEINGGNE